MDNPIKTENKFLKAVNKGNCTLVREILACNSISPRVLQQSLGSPRVKNHLEMLNTLIEYIDINSISKETALLCVFHRIDKVVDHVITNEMLNATVRLHLECAMSGRMDFFDHFYDPPFVSLFTISCAEKTLAYMDQRACAVQRQTIEQHLGGPHSAAPPKRL